MVRALKVKLVSFLMTFLIDQTTRADSTCKVEARMEIIAGNIRTLSTNKKCLLQYKHFTLVT